jgi:hypothetical protein
LSDLEFAATCALVAITGLRYILNESVEQKLRTMSWLSFMLRKVRELTDRNKNIAIASVGAQGVMD